MKKLSILICLLAILAYALPAAAGAHPHERDGFMLGFNIGGGSATAKPDVGEDSSGGGGAASFRLAWALDNQFLIGLESTAWTGETDSNADFSLYSHKLNFTWYPAARGWFLRAGFGSGSGELDIPVSGGTLTLSESGGTFGVGGGHEWRLTQKFALGVAVDLNTVDLDYGRYDYFNFTAQLNWYF